MPIKRPMPQVPPVVVTSILDINRILEGFKPGAETMLRKCLVDGFEMVKRFEDLGAFKIDEAAFGGFKPATPPLNATKSSWLDALIHTKMGGRRDGLTVIWDIPEGRYVFDPWTGNVEKVK